jgi:hypothetical protein
MQVLGPETPSCGCSFNDKTLCCRATPKKYWKLDVADGSTPDEGSLIQSSIEFLHEPSPARASRTGLALHLINFPCATLTERLFLCFSRSCGGTLANRC